MLLDGICYMISAVVCACIGATVDTETNFPNLVTKLWYLASVLNGAMALITVLDLLKN